MIITRRDIAYTVYSRLEESLRIWVRDLLLNTYGGEWTNYLPKGFLNKTLERANIPDSAVVDPAQLLDESDLPDINEIVNYKNGLNVFPDGRSRDEFRALTERLYELRNKIAHIKGSFTVLDLDALLGIVGEIVPVIGAAAAPLEEIIEDIQSNPEKVVVKMPENFLVLDTEPLPKHIHNVPSGDYATDGGFIGRRDELKKLSEVILGGLHRVVTITGAGGVGKTALAHQFCLNLLRKPSIPFDGIVWVSAKEEKLTLTGIEQIEPGVRNYEDLLDSILTTFGWSDVLQQSQSEKEECVYTLLRAGEKGILLVVDNLETIKDETIREFLKDFPPPSRVVITSRMGLGEVERRYPLKEMLPSDAVSLLRTVAREKGISGLAKMPEEVLLKYVERMARYPLTIKWVVGQVALGKNIDLVLGDLTASSGDVARFCFDHIFNHYLSVDARMILYALAAGDKPLVHGVLLHVSNLPVDRLDGGLKELTVASFVVPEYRKASDGTIETVYDLLSLTRNYIRAQLHAHPDILSEIRGRIEMVENLIEESTRAGRSYGYSLRDLGASTEEEKIAAMWAVTGFQRYQAGDYDGAVSAFKKALQIAPKFAAVYRNWATMESEAGYDDKADELMKSAVKIAPKDPKMWFIWGNMEKKRRRVDRAFEYLSEARRLAPKDVPILGALADVEKRRGNYQNAADLFREALAENETAGSLASVRHEIICLTSLADNLRRWAEELAKGRRWDETLEKLRLAHNYISKAVELDSRDSRAVDTFREVSLDLAIRQFHSNKFDDSVPLFVSVVREVPRSWKEKTKSITACYYLAKGYHSVGRKEEASKYFAIGVKLLYEGHAFDEKYKELQQEFAEQRRTGVLFRVLQGKGYGFVDVAGMPGISAYLHRSEVQPPVSLNEFDSMQGCSLSFVLLSQPGNRFAAKRARIV